MARVPGHWARREPSRRSPRWDAVSSRAPASSRLRSSAARRRTLRLRARPSRRARARRATRVSRTPRPASRMLRRRLRTVFRCRSPQRGQRREAGSRKRRRAQRRRGSSDEQNSERAERIEGAWGQRAKACRGCLPSPGCSGGSRRFEDGPRASFAPTCPGVLTGPRTAGHVPDRQTLSHAWIPGISWRLRALARELLLRVY